MRVHEQPLSRYFYEYSKLIATECLSMCWPTPACHKRFVYENMRVSRD